MLTPILQLEFAEKDRREYETLAIARIGLISAKAITSAIRVFREGLDPRVPAIRKLSEIKAVVKDGLADAFLLGAYRQYSHYRLALSFASDRVQLTDEELEEVRKAFDTQATEITSVVERKVERKLGEAMYTITEQGMNARDGVKLLRRTFLAAGISPEKPYLVESIFRTQSAIAYSAGRWQADQDEAVQEILWGYEYLTAGDDRVREEHTAYDGMKLPKDDAFWTTGYPPNGWNCRCIAIPVFKDENPRASTREKPLPTEGFRFNPGLVSPKMTEVMQKTIDALP